MIIQACYSVWMEENRIGASIASIHDYVDRIVVIDGRYKGFARDKPVESTDHTRVIAQKFPKVKFIQLHEALNPAEKRMMTFGWESDPADWYIVIDADEIMFGKGMNRAFDILRNNDPPAKGWKVKTFLELNRFPNQPYTFTRIFQKSAGLHYQKNHWQRHDKDGQDMDSYCKLIPADVTILQMNELCPEWRRNEKPKWVSWRTNQGDGW